MVLIDAPLLPDMEPWQFLRAARTVMEDFPNCRLVKNQVGNLAIVVDDEFVGYVDLRDGTVHPAV